MKSKFRYILIASLYFLSYFFPRKKHFGKTKIIVFHHIDNPVQFEEVINKLSRKYNFISFEDYISGNIDKRKINLIFSLDDGYESWFTYGRPIFNSFNISPILSINSDFMNLDKKDSFAYCKNHINTWPEKALSWQQLNELNSSSVLISSHGLEHVDMICHNLSYLNKVNCVSNDKLYLEEKLGCKIKAFTYPYGRYNSDSIDIIKGLNFDFAFTSDSGFLSDEQFPYKIKRTNIGMRGYYVTCGFIEGFDEVLTSISSRVRKLIKYV
ncbi:hypothetical protein MACH09_01650 [Vibrio sp. MACH09]|uniref:polysaccharide deacetylase family protein n=1 Tax=Vibrio sp. MACH09 TaxID=3025122 RepID=UPI00278E643F|nr:polysaccharide deacetylase family protein [Vibrio sp. MACH09]GLO59657.1 hypothetical protein MACH09_01650 [Vibrio sp. MACH09]